MLRSTPGDDDDDERPPEQNWLQSLKEQASSEDGSAVGGGGGDLSTETATTTETSADVAIPTTGVSVSDAMVDAQEKFVADLREVRGLASPGTAAAITTTSSGGAGDEPTRYLVALSPPPKRELEEAVEDEDEGGEEAPHDDDASSAASSTSPPPRRYALVDIPPYSDALVDQMKSFMGGPNSSLAAILVTCRDAIHYDEAPAVYVTRKSDVTKWRSAFPEAELVAYRLDAPRDCRELITQTLDGEGPWALDEDINVREEGAEGVAKANATFFETGRPLTYEEWDEDIARQVLDGGDIPDEDGDDDASEPDDAHLYTPQMIREREEDRRVLAVYTPGRTFGSVSYVFPESGVCCSGFAIPVEDKTSAENLGGAGPNLDFRGYVTTSAAGVEKQVESARTLAETYGDRFRAVLPARGEPLVLGGGKEERRAVLRGVLEQYERIGRVYEQLGITR